MALYWHFMKKIELIMTPVLLITKHFIIVIHKEHKEDKGNCLMPALSNHKENMAVVYNADNLLQSQSLRGRARAPLLLCWFLQATESRDNEK